MIKEPETLKKPKQPQHKGLFTLDDLIVAIKRAFVGVTGRIDPRFLWTDCDVHRFRVNCWSNAGIQHSEFVLVIEKGKKLTVRREHGK